MKQFISSLVSCGVLVAASLNAQPILSLDFNDRDNNDYTDTAPGFEAFVMDDGSSTVVKTNPTVRKFGKFTVTISDITGDGYDDRKRTAPTNTVAFTGERIFQDSIFACGRATANGLRVRVQGLAPKQLHRVTVWSFDANSPSNRVSNWYANGTLVKERYTFDGSIRPVTDSGNRFDFKVITDASGELLVEGRRDSSSVGGTGTPDIGVFLNAIRITALRTEPAESFYADFNIPDTRGMALIGDAKIQASEGINNSGYLLLTPADKEKTGSMIVSGLASKEKINSFVAAFQMRIDGGTGADGVGFFLGKFPSLFAETGKHYGTDEFVRGLGVCFHTWRPGQKPPAIEVTYDDVVLGEWETAELRNSSRFSPVVIHFNAGGVLNVFLNGHDVVKNFRVEKFSPATGRRFGMAARTGGKTDNHCIDNLAILTGTQEHPLPELDVASIARQMIAWSGVENRTETLTFPSGGEMLKGTVYRPSSGLDPRPLVMFLPHAGSDVPPLLQFFASADNPFPSVGSLFMRNDFVLFVPQIETGARADAKTGKRQPLQVFQDALTFLSAQGYVDGKRVAVIGDGSRATALLDPAWAALGAKALVLISPEVNDAARQHEVKRGLERLSAPVLLVAQSNAAMMELSSACSPILERKGALNQLQLYPPWAESAVTGQQFAGDGIELWGSDVINFLKDAINAAGPTP